MDLREVLLIRGDAQTSRLDAWRKLAIGALALVPAARIGWPRAARRARRQPDRRGDEPARLLDADAAAGDAGAARPSRSSPAGSCRCGCAACWASRRSSTSASTSRSTWASTSSSTGRQIGKDIVKRKFITVGFVAFVLLIPLAVTSTDGMVRRLGFARWKRLHRLVYRRGRAGRRALRLAREVRPAAAADLRGRAGGAARHSFAALGASRAASARRPVAVRTSRSAASATSRVALSG